MILLDSVVNELSKLPGIGKKTALRLALQILRNGKEEATLLGSSIIDLVENVVYCQECHNISDKEICDICSNPRRDNTIVCVVENIRDVLAIENTQQFNGKFHVLGGLISPLNGISPKDLEIESLVERVAKGELKEIILALSPNMEGDTTAFYIYKKLAGHDITVTTIARGVPIGDELEYADEITLGRSILNRIKYN